jgi:hypothetical protein
MAYSTTIAELLHSGIAVRPAEAIAIAQKLINDQHQGSPQPPFGPPSIENVVIDEQGTVTCRASAVKPAVSEIGILLDRMLPAGTRVPRGLRYTLARALLNVDAPPFDSIEELSSALSRFERHQRDVVIRDLTERARALTGGAASVAAIIPFKPLAPARLKTERRHPLPAAVAAELRRDLRRADLERYAREAATTLPDLRGALGRQKRPIGVVMAGLGAGFVLIASGELMHLGPATAPEGSTPSVKAPAPRLPEPATPYVPPAHVIDAVYGGGGQGHTGSVVRLSHGTPSRATMLSGPSAPNRAERGVSRSKPRAVPDARLGRRGDRRTRPTGVLERFHLNWIRNIFTYRCDL